MYDYEIVEEVVKDLKLITTANGYNNTLKNVHDWFQPLNSVSQFPLASVWVLDDNQIMKGSGAREQYRTLDLYIVIQVQGSTTKKDIQRIGSSWKEDILNWANHTKGEDKALFTALLTNDRARLDVKTFVDRIAVYSWYVSAISPAYVFDKAQAEIIFQIKLEYTT